MEGTMRNIVSNRESFVRRTNLYCVWIRANGGENAPLVQLWIDPSMRTFESRTVQDDHQAAFAAEDIDK